MSGKERTRLIALEAVKRGEISLKEAAERMGISPRQAIRLKARYLGGGAGGIIHRSRGRPGNRRADPAVRERAVELYRRQYGDFGPTLAAEKLAERDDLQVHPETLRRWLLATGDWRGCTRHRRHRSCRPRRERLGQMLQIDGSDHEWFEDRGPRACLMVLIDDATNRQLMHMAPTETTAAALAVLRKWVERWGVPQSLYADRKTVYWSPTALEQRQLRDRREVRSDFGRVLHGLDIAPIPAYSPQGKGRVERCNGTLQDRLVKELRLRNISTIEEANAMLDEFADQLNARLERPPLSELDAHRVFAPREREQRELAFSIDYERTVARDHTVVVGRECWQIVAQPDAPRPGTRVTMLRAMDGMMRCRWQGRLLKIRRFNPKAEAFRRRCGFDSVTTPESATGATASRPGSLHSRPRRP